MVGLQAGHRVPFVHGLQPVNRHFRIAVNAFHASYVENHKKDIEQGDHHDPTALELYCEMEPEADECRVYED